MRTLGWDTVFVISNSRVNASLAQNLQHLLPTFDVSMATDPALSAKGDLKSWEIVQGGSGKLLLVKLTILKGELTVGASHLPPELLALAGGAQFSGQDAPTDLAGVQVVLSLFLRVLPRPDASEQELEFFLEQVAYSSDSSSTPGFVTPVNVIDPSGKLSAIQKTLLSVAIAAYVVQNAQKISFAFASINLVPPSANTWLTPVKSDYAYLEKTGAADGFLAVLSVTTNRDISALPRSIDPGAISPGNTGSFLISDNVFLTNVILPYLPTAYATTPNRFRLDESAHAIRNNGSFETIPVKSGAITYYPVIDDLTINTDGEGLVTAIRGSCDLKAGINMTYQIRTRNRATFDPVNKTVSFQPDPNPESGHSASIPWYFWFLGPIAVLITELVVKLISDSIAKSLDQLARDALSIARNPPTSIQWTGARPIDVRTAGVNGDFFMMGDV